MRGCLVLALALARLQHVASAALSQTGALAEIRKLVADRGRCTLAEIGDHLRVAGIPLPAETKLSDLVLKHADEFHLSGPPNNRKVGRLADTKEMAMLDTARGVLLKHGPMTSAELRLRLREQRTPIPGLVSLLQRHSADFHVEGGAVRLASAPSAADEAGAAAEPAAPEPLVRLHSLGLPTAMEEVRIQVQVHEVIFVDLDNHAFALETAAERAAAASDVLLLACCARAHNPRLSQRLARCMQALAAEGRLRLIRPERDGPNAADFVLAFWAGWLHAWLPDDARFVLVSSDADLEKSVGDALASLDRHVERNPGWMRL